MDSVRRIVFLHLCEAVFTAQRCDDGLSSNIVQHASNVL